jgi:nitroreductase/NAD-dependent dihydropyrimidine dehydrogenase PreA subunit
MGRFIVDEHKCKRDGICVAVCPMGILAHGEAAPPAQVAGSDALCISCGHCVAACPYGACSLDTMPAEVCPPVRPEWRLSPEQVEHFLRMRRSIRVYKEAPVEHGRIERLIRAARYAPSGHNAQPVRWTVISGREQVRALAGHAIDWVRSIRESKPEIARKMGLDRLVTAWEAGGDPICRSAPHLVLAHAPKGDAAAPSACLLALAYLELAAPAHGLGACWAGYLMRAAANSPALQQALALPDGDALCGAVMLGEPRYRYHRLPERREPQIDWK